MTKKPFKDIYEYRADDGKIFKTDDGVILGTLMYAGKTIKGIVEVEWNNLQRISVMMN